MNLPPEKKLSLLTPGTIWKRRRNGKWERVYLEASKSRLVMNELGSVDFRTEFGSEHIQKKKFISQFEFVGWARIRLTEIADDKNLIPSIEDPRLWLKNQR